MVVCRNESGIVAKKWLSGYNWDVGWSEGVMDAEESGEYIEKLNCHAWEDLPTYTNMFEHVW